MINIISTIKGMKEFDKKYTGDIYFSFKDSIETITSECRDKPAYNWDDGVLNIGTVNYIDTILEDSFDKTIDEIKEIPLDQLNEDELKVLYIQPAIRKYKQVSVDNINTRGRSNYKISGLSFGSVDLKLLGDAGCKIFNKLDFPDLSYDDYMELKNKTSKSFYNDLSSIKLSCFHGLLPWEILDILNKLEEENKNAGL